MRLKLVWDAVDDLTVTVKGEVGASGVLGRQVGIIDDGVSDSSNPLFTGLTYSEIGDDT